MQPIKPKRDDFSSRTVRSLAERAAFICTMPQCNRLTLGPDFSQTDKSITTGRAAHIKAAASGGPRYDINQSPSERKSIGNGFWACGACADLIDKNGGGDYSVDSLLLWKMEHEKYVKLHLEGKLRIINRPDRVNADRSVARKILRSMADKGFLFQPYCLENPQHVLESIVDLRRKASDLSIEATENSTAERSAVMIAKSCRVYMNSNSAKADIQRMNETLATARKAIGMTMRDLATFYGVEIPEDLIEIVPEINANKS